MQGWRQLCLGGPWYIDKHVESRLDYGVDLTAFLQPDDSIAGNPNIVWTLSEGFTKEDESYEAPIAYVLVDGGPAVGTVGTWRVEFDTVQGRREVAELMVIMVAENVI